MKNSMKHFRKTLPMVLALLIVAGCWNIGTAQQSAPNRDATIAALWSAIDSNNTALKALRWERDARKSENRTGLYPADPTVGISYLRPNPRLSDRRLDFEISQELEFPTVYGHRKRVARLQNQTVEAIYALERKEILHEAVETWLQWRYHTAYADLLRLQNDHAHQISNAYQRAFDAGQINILERNKARINAINTQKDYDLNAVKRQAIFDRLVTLNGGVPLPELVLQSPENNMRTGSRPFGTAFPEWELPASEDLWWNETQAHSLQIDALERKAEVARAQEKLVQAEQLPNLEIGFMREQDIEVDFRGVTFGVSVPLWQHRNRRRQARLQTTAQEHMLLDAAHRFELDQRALFRKAFALKTQLERLQTIRDESTGPDLLRRALDLGEITLVDYLVEQGMYYELMESILQTELEYRLIQAEMYKEFHIE